MSENAPVYTHRSLRRAQKQARKLAKAHPDKVTEIHYIDDPKKPPYEIRLVNKQAGLTRQDKPKSSFLSRFVADLVTGRTMSYDDTAARLESAAPFSINRLRLQTLDTQDSLDAFYFPTIDGKAEDKAVMIMLSGNGQSCTSHLGTMGSYTLNHDIATLAYNNRGLGLSTGRVKSMGDLVQDALTAVQAMHQAGHRHMIFYGYSLGGFSCPHVVEAAREMFPDVHFDVIMDRAPKTLSSVVEKHATFSKRLTNPLSTFRQSAGHFRQWLGRKLGGLARRVLSKLGWESATKPHDKLTTESFHVEGDNMVHEEAAMQKDFEADTARIEKHQAKMIQAREALLAAKKALATQTDDQSIYNKTSAQLRMQYPQNEHVSMIRHQEYRIVRSKYIIANERSRVLGSTGHAAHRHGESLDGLETKTVASQSRVKITGAQKVLRFIHAKEYRKLKVVQASLKQACQSLDERYAELEEKTEQLTDDQMSEMADIHDALKLKRGELDKVQKQMEDAVLDSQLAGDVGRVTVINKASLKPSPEEPDTGDEPPTQIGPGQ